MYRSGKKKRKTGDCRVRMLLAAGLWLCPAAYAGAEEAGEYIDIIVPELQEQAVSFSEAAGKISGDKGICDEDEYVILDDGYGYVEIFDSRGNCIGRCRTWVNEDRGASTVPKNGMVSYRADDTWTVYSMVENRVILEGSAEHTNYTLEGDACLVTDREEGMLSLYDASGALLHSISDPAWAGEETGYGSLIALDGGYLIGYHFYEEPPEESWKEPVWVSKDGCSIRSITDPKLVRQFQADRIRAFGDRLLIVDLYNRDCYYVCDLDGRILLDGISDFLYDSEWDSYEQDPKMNTMILLKREQDIYRAFHENLEWFADIPYSEDEYPINRNGYITGVAYEELGGNVCSGFAEYNADGRVPYARVEGGWNIFAGGELIFVAGEPQEEPAALNDFCVQVISYEDEAGWRSRIVERDTGNIICQQEPLEYVSHSVGEGYYIVSERDDLEPVSTTIYNDRGKVLYQEAKCAVRPWKNGFVYMKRGIYSGIADREGQWIARTTGQWRE